MNPDGRPPIEIDWKQVEGLCRLHATGEEISGFLGISYDTLERGVKAKYSMSFAEYFKQKSAGGKISLRRRQYTKAVNEGHPTMLIWLGKQLLGQTDKMEHSGDQDNPLQLNYKMDEKDQKDD